MSDAQNNRLVSQLASLTALYQQLLDYLLKQQTALGNDDLNRFRMRTQDVVALINEVSFHLSALEMDYRASQMTKEPQGDAQELVAKLQHLATQVQDATESVLGQGQQTLLSLQEKLFVLQRQEKAGQAHAGNRSSRHLIDRIG